MRKGMGKGTGKGYKNMIGVDSRVHSLSAKGIKQPQRMNPIIINTPNKLKFNKKIKSILYYCIWQINEMESNDNYYKNEFLKQELEKIGVTNNLNQYQEIINNYTKINDNTKYKKLVVDFKDTGSAGRMTFYDMTPQQARIEAVNNLKNPEHTFYSKDGKFKIERVYRETPDKIINPNEVQ